MAAKNKISQLKRFQSILILVYLCLRVSAIYLRGFYESLIYLSSKSLQALILQAMILEAIIFGLKNKISQLKGFKSISITVYLCLRVLAIYLEEFYGGIIYLSSKKSAGYDFSGYDFGIFFENFFRP